mmetsp:Transcript_19227/g.42465  ORF Transcript_19227/g.42465 Transcript_19227/m.42465 type:complete len:258 (-) Transcript_19227:923-1696(-)
MVAPIPCILMKTASSPPFPYTIQHRSALLIIHHARKTAKVQSACWVATHLRANHHVLLAPFRVAALEAHLRGERLQLFAVEETIAIHVEALKEVRLHGIPRQRACRFPRGHRFQLLHSRLVASNTPPETLTNVLGDGLCRRGDVIRRVFGLGQGFHVSSSLRRLKVLEFQIHPDDVLNKVAFQDLPGALQHPRVLRHFNTFPHGQLQQRHLRLSHKGDGPGRAALDSRFQDLRCICILRNSMGFLTALGTPVNPKGR